MATTIKRIPPATEKFAHIERTIALEREAPRWRGLFSFLTKRDTLF